MPAGHKAWLRGELAADERRTRRAALASIRAQIAELKAARRLAMRDAVAACQRGRLEVKDRAKELRRLERERTRAAILAAKLEARSMCAASKATVRTRAGSVLEAARASLAQERAFQRELRRAEGRAEKKERSRATAIERRQESDEEVTRNLPDDLVPLWRKVRRTMTPAARWSRTEQFLHYAEAHPGEVVDALAEVEGRATAAAIRDLERQEHEYYRAAQRGEAAPF